MNDTKFLLFDSCFSKEDQYHLLQKAIEGMFQLFVYFRFEGVDRYLLLNRDQLINIKHSGSKQTNIYLTDEQIINHKLISPYNLERLCITNDGTEKLLRFRSVPIKLDSLFFLKNDIDKYKRKRPSPMHKVIIRAYKNKKIELKREPTIEEVLVDIKNKKFDEDDLIENIDKNGIYYVDYNDNKKKMSLKSVKNFISEYRGGKYFDQ